MILVRQIKAARALLGWSQVELAEKSGVSKPTIERIESPDDGPIDSRHAKGEQVESALRTAGIEFLNDGEIIGVTLANKKFRFRARR
jgi:transcriptional regulator with XRE-family HTH domain